MQVPDPKLKIRTVNSGSGAGLVVRGLHLSQYLRLDGLMVVNNRVPA